MGVGDFGEDPREGLLHERIWMQLDHRVHVEASQHIVEVALVVVDVGPAASPPWQAVDLRDGARANDWNSASAVSH